MMEASPAAAPPALATSSELSPAALTATAATRFKGFLVTFFPGAAQGATTVLLGHPLDTAKTRMQASGPNAQRSALVTIARMVRSEGPRSLFRGCSPPLVMEGAKRSVQFALWDIFRGTHARDQRAREAGGGGEAATDGRRVPLHALLSAIGSSPFASGAVAGGVGTTIGCPMHVIKIQTQYQTQEGTRNAWTCMVGIWQREGLRGFYRGYKYNLLKDIFFAGTYLGMYGWLRQRWAPPEAPTHGGSRAFLAGATASVVTWTLLYPLDTAKTLVQAGQQHHLTRQLLRDPRRLYRGLAASLLKAGPVSGASMCVYEYTKSLVETW